MSEETSPQESQEQPNEELLNINTRAILSNIREELTQQFWTTDPVLPEAISDTAQQLFDRYLEEQRQRPLGVSPVYTLGSSPTDVWGRLAEPVETEEYHALRAEGSSIRDRIEQIDREEREAFIQDSIFSYRTRPYGPTIIRDEPVYANPVDFTPISMKVRVTPEKYFKFDTEKITNTMTMIRVVQALIRNHTLSESDVKALGLEDLVIEKD